jgi:hypothetical protein
MIETADAVTHLHQLLDEGKSTGIKAFDLGTTDLFFDLGIFPHPRHNHQTFWDTVEPLIIKLTDNHFTYGHTPFNLLLDYKMFRQAIAKVSSISDGKFEIRTLTNGQTRAAIKPITQEEPIQMEKEPSLNMEDVKSLVKSFQSKEFSFSINDQQQFITPHEYVAALNLLKHG